MGHQNNFGFIFDQIFDCGQSGADPEIIQNFSVFQSQVEIHPHKSFFARDIDIFQ